MWDDERPSKRDVAGIELSAEGVAPRTSSLLGRRIRRDAPAKPGYMEPCNGCGVCCVLEPCAIARGYIPDLADGPCPALVRDDGRYTCDMTRRPGRYMGLPNDWADPIIGAMFAKALGIGRGCDASD